MGLLSTSGIVSRTGVRRRKVKLLTLSLLVLVLLLKQSKEMGSEKDMMVARRKVQLQGLPIKILSVVDDQILARWFATTSYYY